MNRKFLEELGLEKEVIDQVMAEHGKTIQSVKPDDYEELKSAKATLEQQLEELNGTLTATNEKYASVDETLQEKDRLIKDYETTNLKYRIANQAGIPMDIASRLAGETEEEIKADAEKLAGFVNKKQPLPLKGTEPPKVDEKEQAYTKILENLN